MTHRSISNSEMVAFLKCKRQWYFNTIRRLTPRHDPDSGDAARIGTLVHSGVEDYYNGVPPEVILARFREINLPHDMAVEYKENWIFAGVILEGYFEWLEETGADQALEILATEEKLSVPTDIDGVSFIGKLDLQARNRQTGELLLIDHKVVANFALALADIHLLRQPMLYAAMQRIIHPDEPLAGIEWNLMRRVKRTGKSEPPFYMRYPVIHSVAQLRQFWHEANFIVGEILRHEELVEEYGHMACPPTPTKDCSWQCEFYSICGATDDPDQDHEQLIEIGFRRHDPLERYEVDPVEELA